MTRDDANKELIRLIELDYERTATFINGVTGTSSTLRGWAVTIWLAITSLAIGRGDWQLALLAAAVAIAFLLIDGYHAWLYGEALAHASALERLSARYYDSLGRGLDDKDAQIDLQIVLQSHRFGMYRNFKRFSAKSLWYVRPRVLFRVFYPMLILVATGLALILALTPVKPESQCLIARETGIEFVDCTNLIVDLRPSSVEPPASATPGAPAPTPADFPVAPTSTVSAP